METKMTASAVITKYSGGQYGASVISDQPLTNEEFEEYRKSAQYGNGRKVASAYYESNEMVIEGKSYE